MTEKNDKVGSIINFKFLKKAIIGASICLLLIYLATLPFILKPKYESEAIVYVPLTLLSQQLNQHGIGFGNDKEIDLYIQLLKSKQLADSILQSPEFGFNTSKGNSNNSQLYSSLESKMRIEKTRYGSVSIKVRDENPQKAADIANKTIEFGERIKYHILNPNRIEALKNAQSLYDQKRTQIDSLETIIYSYEPGRAKAIDNFQYNKAINIYNKELIELIERKDAFEREKRNFDTPLPKPYIVSSAFPASKPVWPIPWLLCLIGVCLYIFIVFAIEIVKRDLVKTPK
jgi:capsular polysaccharide biosynthesis protein